MNNNDNINYFSKEKCSNKITLIIEELSSKYKEKVVLEKLESYIENNLLSHLEQICNKEKKKYIQLLENENLREEKKIKIINLLKITKYCYGQMILMIIF